MWQRGAWTKNGEIVYGYWRWSFPEQRFIIKLDVTCRYSGRLVEIKTSNDNPDFNGWSFVEET